MGRTGRSLTSAVEAYNKAVGSLERNVLPQARRFHDLGAVAGSDKEIPALEQVNAVARDLQAPELTVAPRWLAGESGLELVEGSRRDDRDLPGAAAT